MGDLDLSQAKILKPASLKDAKITKEYLSGLRELLFDFSDPGRFTFFGMRIYSPASSRVY